jgi:hypothetical protein
VYALSFRSGRELSPAFGNFVARTLLVRDAGVNVLVGKRARDVSRASTSLLDIYLGHDVRYGD